MKLIDKVKKYSGFYNETSAERYLEFLALEVKELQEAYQLGSRKDIASEVGDVLSVLYLSIEKLKGLYGINDMEILMKQVRKYKLRTPHIFEDRYLTRQEELEQNYRNRGMEIPEIHRR